MPSASIPPTSGCPAPGRTWLVTTSQARRAQEALRGVSGVVAVAQIGTSLRVLGANGDLKARIDARLREANVAGTVEPTAPNLEDVFVAATVKPEVRTHEPA